MYGVPILGSNGHQFLLFRFPSRSVPGFPVLPFVITALVPSDSPQIGRMRGDAFYCSRLLMIRPTISKPFFCESETL